MANWDFVELSSVPYREIPYPTGLPDSERWNRVECHAWRDQIRRQYPHLNVYIIAHKFNDGAMVLTVRARFEVGTVREREANKAMWTPMEKWDVFARSYLSKMHYPFPNKRK